MRYFSIVLALFFAWLSASPAGAAGDRLVHVVRFTGYTGGSIEDWLQGKGFGELRTEIMILAVMTVVLLPTGLICSRFAIRRAKREGSLVQY